MTAAAVMSYLRNSAGRSVTASSVDVLTGHLHLAHPVDLGQRRDRDLVDQPAQLGDRGVGGDGQHLDRDVVGADRQHLGLHVLRQIRYCVDGRTDLAGDLVGVQAEVPLDDQAGHPVGGGGPDRSSPRRPR